MTDKNKKITLAFSTNPEFKERITRLAEERGVSVSAIINLALFNYFQYVKARERMDEVSTEE